MFPSQTFSTGNKTMETSSSFLSLLPLLLAELTGSSVPIPIKLKESMFVSHIALLAYPATVFIIVETNKQKIHLAETAKWKHTEYLFGHVIIQIEIDLRLFVLSSHTGNFQMCICQTFSGASWRAGRHGYWDGITLPAWCLWGCWPSCPDRYHPHL